jgi:hypothetical protein
MRKRVIKIGAGIVVLGALAGGGVAWATAGDNGDETVTGPAADRARAAALARVTGGTAIAVERESENGAAWEVEVRRGDGSTVDVLLDAQYRVILVEDDSDAREGGSDEFQDDD